MKSTDGGAAQESPAGGAARGSPGWWSGMWKPLMVERHVEAPDGGAALVLMDYLVIKTPSTLGHFSFPSLSFWVHLRR